MAEEAKSTGVDPPRGLWGAKVDDKGRLKLPANFAQYLTALQAEKVFITSMDESTGKIYTIPVWNENVKLLESGSGEQRAWGKQLLFRANHNGADAELDQQGRLLLPSEMRRKLGFENAQVYLEAYDGLFNIYSQKVHDEMMRLSDEDRHTKLAHFEEKGLR